MYKTLSCIIMLSTFLSSHLYGNTERHHIIGVIIYMGEFDFELV